MEELKMHKEVRMIDADKLIEKINGMSHYPAMSMSPSSAGLMGEIESSLQHYFNEQINQCFVIYTQNLISAIQESVSEDLPCLFCRNELKDNGEDDSAKAGLNY